MSYITEFFDANGISHNDPALDLILEVISKGSQDDWALGSGQAALYWQRGDIKKELILTPSGKDSYFVKLSSSNQPDWSYMSFNESGATGDTETYVGGDPWLVPSTLFIDKTLVMEAVKEFYQSGEPSRSSKWIHSNEIEFTDIL